MTRWHLEGSLDETGTVKKIPINKFPFVIGRSKSADLVVLRSGISREHAEIFRVEGKMYLRDLKSTNGTYVNKQRVTEEESLLTHNSVIHFAQFDFKLIDTEYKPAADEMLTVVMNVEGAIYRDSDSPGSDDSVRAVALKNSKGETPQVKKRHNRSDNQHKHAEAEDLALAAGVGDHADSETDRSGNVNPLKNLDQDGEQGAQLKFGAASSNDRVFIQWAWDDSNRRMHIRREARWPAQIMLKSHQSIQCVTKDVSESGIALTSPVSLPDGTLVKVYLNVFYKGKSRDVAVLGVVKHSLITTGSFIVGVQIKSCDKRSSEFIAKFSNRKI